MASVQDQYEAFPYPPVPALALPLPSQGRRLAYETGRSLAEARGLPALAPDKDGLRLLVVGCGTLEAVVIAEAHPRAREIVAVDLSARSLAILRRRLTLARLVRWLPWRWRRLPPVRTVQADFRTGLFAEAPFDYILATNVLHHTEDPAASLAQLSALLKPKGLLRLVTYPKASRIWMRRTGAYLQEAGLGPHTPRLIHAARVAIRRLPADDPRRQTFETSPEAETTAGLVDAFLHAIERPLSPLAWRDAAGAAGLTLVGEGQDPECCSSHLDALLPEAARLDPWAKLQLLDDALLLWDNPVLWLVKTDASAIASNHEPDTPSEDHFSPDAELSANRHRIEDLLRHAGLAPALADTLIAKAHPTP